MKIRAIFFDVYHTLLEVGPPPPDADERWQRLFHDLLHIDPPLGRLDFSAVCSQVVARHHEIAKARGIVWPEICWPAIVTEVLPELAALSQRDQAAFILRQIQTGRTTLMTPETAAALRGFHERHDLLGIASNAQAYTLTELREALEPHGLEMNLFENDLRFWSFENGFSKPNPHVFQILNARLAARGITPTEALMIGDRTDNDIEPARAFGWQTWRLTSLPAPDAAGATEGDWRQLAGWLE
jgi:FMN phosphatase YigB (HAD superfamily)